MKQVTNICNIILIKTVKIAAPIPAYKIKSIHSIPAKTGGAPPTELIVRLLQLSVGLFWSESIERNYNPPTNYAPLLCRLHCNRKLSN